MNSNDEISFPILEHIHNYNVCADTRSIYLHGHIGSDESDPGIDYRMSSMFIKNLNFLWHISEDPIFIHMNSIGGNWSSGMAMYDAIKSCDCDITIIAYGQAESMSSLLLQAADNRVMTKNSFFMCHYGSLSISANLLDVQSAVRQERRFTQTMIDIYASKAVNGKVFKDKSLNHVKNFIKRKMKDGDWYLSAEEAVDHGFADVVL